MALSLFKGTEEAGFLLVICFLPNMKKFHTGDLEILCSCELGRIGSSSHQCGCL